MTVNNAVIAGRAKLVMYDLREGSPTRGQLQEVYLGEDNHVLVQIPPGIANGYKAYGDRQVILANCATEPHDPEEMKRIDPFTDEIPVRLGGSAMAEPQDRRHRAVQDGLVVTQTPCE